MNQNLKTIIQRILPPHHNSNTFYIIDNVFYSFRNCPSIASVLARMHNLEKVDIKRNGVLLRHDITHLDLLGNYNVNLSFLTIKDLNKLMHMIHGNINVYIMLTRNGKHLSQIEMSRENMMLYQQKFEESGEPHMFVSMLSRMVTEIIPEFVPSIWLCNVDSIERGHYTILRTLEKVEIQSRLGVFHCYCDIFQIDRFVYRKGFVPLSELEANIPTYLQLPTLNEPLYIMQRMYAQALTCLHTMDKNTGHMVPLISLSNKVMHSVNGNIYKYASLIITLIYVWLVSMTLWNKLMHSINGNTCTIYDLTKLCLLLKPQTMLISGDKIPEPLKPIFKSVFFYIHHFATSEIKDETELLKGFDSNGFTFTLDKTLHKAFLEHLHQFRLNQCLNSLVPRTLTYKLMKQINGHGHYLYWYSNGHDLSHSKPIAGPAKSKALIEAKSYLSSDLEIKKPNKVVADVKEDAKPPLEEKEDERLVSMLTAWDNLKDTIDITQCSLSKIRKARAHILMAESLSNEEFLRQNPDLYKVHKYDSIDDKWIPNSEVNKDISMDLVKFDLLNEVIPPYRERKCEFVTKTGKSTIFNVAGGVFYCRGTVNIQGQVMAVNSMAEIGCDQFRHQDLNIISEEVYIDKSGAHLREIANPYYELIVLHDNHRKIVHMPLSENDGTQHALKLDYYEVLNFKVSNLGKPTHPHIENPLSTTRFQFYNKLMPTKYSKYQTSLLLDSPLYNDLVDANTEELYSREIVNWNNYHAVFSLTQKWISSLIISLSYLTFHVFLKYKLGNWSWIFDILTILHIFYEARKNSAVVYRDKGYVSLNDESLFNGNYINPPKYNLVNVDHYLVVSILCFRLFLKDSWFEVIDERLVEECWENMRKDMTWDLRYATCQTICVQLRRNMKNRNTKVFSVDYAGKTYLLSTPVVEAATLMVCSYSKLAMDMRPGQGFLQPLG